MNDAQSARLTLETLELMTKCQQIAETGDRDGAVRLAESASVEIQERIVILRGGMLIGEVPRLESDDWPAFVQAQRDHVRRLEQER